MYLPRHFEQSDPARLQCLMREHPLASLVTLDAGGLCADPIPLEYEPGGGPCGTLVGHVARANPLWRHAAGASVLAIFNGPQAYVSPNWYPSKAATHQVVPTWNYSVVQARGVLEAVEDPVWLRQFLARLTQRHESAQPAPWSVDDAPEAYVQQLLRAIVGIRIPLTQLVGKFKQSQNRSAADRLGVAAGLRAGSEVQRAVADAVAAPHERAS